METEKKTPSERAEDLGCWCPTCVRPHSKALGYHDRTRDRRVRGILTLVGQPFGITLWHWLKALVVPAMITGGGLWFNRQQRERELAIANEQRERDVEIAERRTQDEALQAYLDQMSDMLILNKDQPSLYKARQGDSLSSVARARTLTVLLRQCQRTGNQVLTSSLKRSRRYTRSMNRHFRRTTAPR